MKRLLFVPLVALALAGIVACAAKGVRNQTRVAALGVVDAAVAVSQAESELYASSVYAKDTHDTLVEGKLKILYAAQSFERAAKSIPDGSNSLPVAVEKARIDVLRAVESFEKLVPAVGAAKGQIDVALQALRAALTRQAMLSAPAPVSAQMPGGGAYALLAMATMIARLAQSSRTLFGELRLLLKKAGATDEELDAAGVKVDAEIERVETTERGQ